MSVYTDFHTHCLPGIDDGAKDVAMSLGMCQSFQTQKVERIIATPHYFCHKEPPSAFLSRRRAAYDALAASGAVLPCIVQGAEVAVERGLCDFENLDALCIEGTDLMLLELPYTPFKKWMLDMIENIAYQYNITPVLAHLNRYHNWYSKEDFEQVLANEDFVIQINHDALFSHGSLRNILRLIKRGKAVVFGSDAHNLAERAPCHDRARKVLRAKLGDEEFADLNRSIEKLYQAHSKE